MKLSQYNRDLQLTGSKLINLFHADGVNNYKYIDNYSCCLYINEIWCANDRTT